jgi:ubiquinone/menaquinone biosynthesis C-methylase UbiE
MEETIRYYAKQAVEYDLQYENPGFQNDLRTIKEMLTRTFKGKRVFEVACGTGRWTQYVAEVAATIFAIDANENMLEIARKRQYPSNTVTLVRADAYTPNSSSKKFNGGLAGFWLSHVDLGRMEQFLKAFHSWLEAGAVVIMFDDMETSDRMSATSRTDKHGNRYEMRTLLNGERFEIIENFFSREHLQNLIEGYGTDLHFETLETKWFLQYRSK